MCCIGLPNFGPCGTHNPERVLIWAKTHERHCEANHVWQNTPAHVLHHLRMTLTKHPSLFHTPRPNFESCKCPPGESVNSATHQKLQCIKKRPNKAPKAKLVPPPRHAHPRYCSAASKAAAPWRCHDATLSDMIPNSRAPPECLWSSLGCGASPSSLSLPSMR